MENNDDLMRQAFETIKLLQSKLNEVKPNQYIEDDPIAITGMSCQVPGASSVPVFWDQLINKFDGVSCYPEKRWSMLSGFFQDMSMDVSGIYGGYLSDIDVFDPGLFGISPREAKCIDPQQRLILMNAFQAIENARIKDLPDFRRTGVFMSLYQSEYVNLSSGYDIQDALFFSTGNAASMAANRLSYIYNFSGPSVVLDTACSSSLYGIESAIRYLESGDIDYAIVGGVSLNLFPFTTKMLQDSGMLSPDGKCHTFDASANGYVQGEGVGVVVLERYSNVKNCSRRAYALIKGAAVNQDGRTNGLTAPNGIAQESVIKAACKKANISPGQIQYIETHGTGTYLGDPIEVEAIGNVISDHRSPDNEKCVLGCLKTNIGHLEPAAGILSAIKAALCITMGKIPGNNHLNEVNPLLQVDNYSIMLPQDVVEWDDKEKFAGVSSFGFGGSNGHIVMSNPESEFAYHGEDVRRYLTDRTNGKSYWYLGETQIKAPPVEKRGDSSSFLPYRLIDGPLELFRAVASFNSEQLLGGQDTGNFHIGFYIESIYKIMNEKFSFHRCLIEKITFDNIFFIPVDTNIEIQIIVNSLVKKQIININSNKKVFFSCKFYYRYNKSNKWIDTASADVCLSKIDTEQEIPELIGNLSVEKHHQLTEDEFYTHYGKIGFPVNGFIRAIESLSLNENEGLADIKFYKDSVMYSLGAHPGFLDAVLQPALVIAGVDKLHMTTKMLNIMIHSTIAENDCCQLYTKIVRNNNEEMHVQWVVCTKNSGLPIIQCEQTVLKSIGSKKDMLWVQEPSIKKQGDTKSILDIVADLLDAKKEDIPLDASLIDLGMNSIMIMNLSGYMEHEGIPINGSLFEITPAELLELSQSKLQSLSRSNNDAWFRWHRKTSGNQRCLICVPYGFGGASIYKDWPQWIDSSCDVCAIQLPGREDRMNESPYYNMTSLLKDLSPLVMSMAANYEECYFYGQSMGALVSYCLCMDLIEHGNIKGLYVGAFSAPIKRKNPLIKLIDKQLRKFGLADGLPKKPSQLPDEALKLLMFDQERSNELNKIKSSYISMYDIKNLALGDLWLVKSYNITENQVLTIPINVWNGVDDDFVSLKSSEDWQLLTTCKEAFRVHCVNSYHNFIDNKAEEVAANLNDSIMAQNRK